MRRPCGFRCHWRALIGIMHRIGAVAHDASPFRDAGEELVEEIGSVVLALGCGVVVLGLQGGSEIDAGLEEAAVVAD